MYTIYQDGRPIAKYRTKKEGKAYIKFVRKEVELLRRQYLFPRKAMPKFKMVRDK